MAREPIRPATRSLPNRAGRPRAASTLSCWAFLRSGMAAALRRALQLAGIRQAC